MFITEYGWDGIAFSWKEKQKLLFAKFSLVFMIVDTIFTEQYGKIWLSLVHAFRHELCLFT